MDLRVDVERVKGHAAQAQNEQEAWAATLAANPPHIPVAAFGQGLAAEAALINDLVTRGHDIRLAHARRLQDAARASQALVAGIDEADYQGQVALSS